MSQKNKIQPELDHDEDDFDIDNTDYGFIISSSGELKTFFCPDQHNSFPPKEVLKIFKIFKITDLAEVLPSSTTLQ
jgi:hypothetical protein